MVGTDATALVLISQLIVVLFLIEGRTPYCTSQWRRAQLH